VDITLEFDEIKEIGMSVVAISFAFTLVFAGLDSLWKYPNYFFLFMLISLLTVGAGFILHEFAHKITAIYYGGYSRFQMWTSGLVFMLFTSLFGVLFAAPGAVYIYAPKITKRQNGIISLAGPSTNLLLSLFFLGLSFTNPMKIYFPFLESANGVNVWYFGAQINLILALFNAIPAFPLDGSKIFAWNKLVWFGFTVLLLAIQAILFSPILVISWVIMFIFFFVLSRLFFR